MAQAPRLLDVQVSARGAEWEWQLLDQAVVIMSGVKPSCEEAQKEGHSALFEVLSAGYAQPFKKDRE
jgi:hypothetical protein